MARDPLTAVLRLRHLAREGALRDLAAALRQEAACAQAVAALEASIARETETAANLAGDDSVVEAFGVWLRRARMELGTAGAVRDAAAEEVVLGRAVLAAARAAVRAAEELLARQETEQRAAAARAEQRALDEIPPGRAGGVGRPGAADVTLRSSRCVRPAVPGCGTVSPDLRGFRRGPGRPERLWRSGSPDHVLLARSATSHTLSASRAGRQFERRPGIERGVRFQVRHDIILMQAQRPGHSIVVECGRSPDG